MICVPPCPCSSVVEQRPCKAKVDSSILVLGHRIPVAARNGAKACWKAGPNHQRHRSTRCARTAWVGAQSRLVRDGPQRHVPRTHLNARGQVWPQRAPGPALVGLGDYWPKGRKDEGNGQAKRNKGQPRLTINGVPPKFRRIAELYKQFGQEWTGLDWSDQALIDAYNAESYGTPLDERRNGFFIGKQWMGVTVSMWKEDIRKGYLGRSELYADPRLPHWWLDRVLR